MGTRNGLYNPLTTDGTIIVEEIVASTYTTPAAGRQYLQINHDHYNLVMTMMRNEKKLSYHDAVHMISTPYRQFCSIAKLSPIDLCNTRNDKKKAMANYFLESFFYSFFEKQNNTIQLMVAIVYVLVFDTLWSNVKYFKLCLFLLLLCIASSFQTKKNSIALLKEKRIDEN